ncbi:MAG TPA: pre-peptidase C-terminal domain-containing protein [Kofleriaceae bacterium]|nr:pre-peptidase C-terminal domain-containing protein [Kofleriaceae bacterium]
MRPYLTACALAIPLCALIGPTRAHAQACRTAETESNDGQSRANTGVCSATAIAGSLSSRSDVDWYTFTVAAPGTITLSLSHGSGNDFDWYLFQPTGSSVARGTTSANPEVGSFTAPAAGTYYFEVVSFSGSGSYTVTATYPTSSGGGGGGGTCSFGPRPPVPSGLVASLVGNAGDACVTPTEPGFLLMGGGTDVDAAFATRIKPRLAGGDIVVLRTTGTDAYNTYFQGLMAPDSVETLIVDTVDKANSDYVDWVVRSAEFVWFAGGDQSDYLNKWPGTRLQAAVKAVRDRGGLLGGTSAGLAVLGDVIYDPDGVTAVDSPTAVLDPCGATMLFADHFLDNAPLANIFLEPHFHQRDRMGRTLSFLARIGGPTSLSPHRSPITGIAIDEATSMFLDKTGRGTVDGAGSVYVLQDDASTQRTQVSCGSPIVYTNVLRTRLTAGGTFDFPTSHGSSAAIRIGIDGRQSSFYSPTNPY